MNAAVIVAAGRGVRFGQADKQLARLAGRPVLWHSVNAFASARKVDTIVVVTRTDLIDRLRKEFADMGIRDRLKLVTGGCERQESVLVGLEACPEGTEIVWVHDGARPLITSAGIDESAAHLEDLDGLVFASPIVDTVKEVEDGIIVGTRPREHFWRAETPQLFPIGTLMRAHRRAAEEGFTGTDDASLVERQGGRVGVFPSPGLNLKITTPEDLDFAEYEIGRRRE